LYRPFDTGGGIARLECEMSGVQYDARSKGSKRGRVAGCACVRVSWREVEKRELSNEAEWAWDMLERRLGAVLPSGQ